MRTGWFKFYRKALDNPVVGKDADHLAIWIWLLSETYIYPCERMFGKEKITVQPGQLITSAQQISRELKCSESKTKRVLNAFESDRQIDQQTTRHGRLITILRWDEYQVTDRQDERQVDDKWTTSERQVDVTKEYKNKRIKNNTTTYKKFTPPTLEEVKAYKAEKNLEYVDAEYFYRYYDSDNWLKGNSRNGKREPMKNWKQTMLTWNKREQERHPQQKPIDDGLDILFGGRA